MYLQKSKLFLAAPRLALVAFLIMGSSPLSAFTNIQTSTSMGLYNDYSKTRHFPLYHSWSIKGYYEGGLETSIEFYLNNDFTPNEWSFYPTQAQVVAPLTLLGFTEDRFKAEIKFGRQLYTEGFDIALLDGIQLPVHWSEVGGVTPMIGYLRSTDFEQAALEKNPIAGLIVWQRVFDIHLRAGFTARDKDFTRHLAFGSALYQFNHLPWQPSVYLKTEWLADSMTFNQSSYEISAPISENIDGRLAYSNLDPRPSNKIDMDSYIYRLFAISPTETLMSDLTWQRSDQLIFNFGIEKALYNSGFQDETAQRQDLSVDIQISSGKWLSPNLTYLKSYGGEVKDFGLKFTNNISSISKLLAEMNMAYVTKINQLNGWAEHIRSGYETHIWNRAKIGFAIEVERNHYYIFDARAQVYVTNYL